MAYAKMQIKLPTMKRQQLEWTCGVISATRLLKSYRHEVTIEQMKDEIGLLRILGYELPIGNTTENIVKVMKKYEEFSRHESFVTFQYLKHKIAQGIPVATLLFLGERNAEDLNFPIPALHWVVLAGFDDQSQELILYDPSDSQFSTESYESFKKRWRWHKWRAYHGGDSFGDALKTNLYGAIDNVLKRNTIFYIDKAMGSGSITSQHVSEIANSSPEKYLYSSSFHVEGTGVVDCGLERAYREAENLGAENLEISKEDLYIDLALMQLNHRDHYERDWLGRRSCNFRTDVKCYSTLS